MSCLNDWLHEGKVCILLHYLHIAILYYNVFVVKALCYGRCLFCIGMYSSAQ